MGSYEEIRRPQLAELRYPGNVTGSQEPVVTWQARDIDEQSRIYWKPDRTNDSNNGFLFCAVELVSGPVLASGEKYVPKPHSLDESDVEVEVLFYGAAYFDGVRHLYMNAGEWLGYQNYPDLERLSKVLQILQQLEREHCQECELG